MTTQKVSFNFFEEYTEDTIVQIDSDVLRTTQTGHFFGDENVLTGKTDISQLAQKIVVRRSHITSISLFLAPEKVIDGYEAHSAWVITIYAMGEPTMSIRFPVEEAKEAQELHDRICEWAFNI